MRCLFLLIYERGGRINAGLDLKEKVLLPSHLVPVYPRTTPLPPPPPFLRPLKVAFPVVMHHSEIIEDREEEMVSSSLHIWKLAVAVFFREIKDLST